MLNFTTTVKNLEKCAKSANDPNMKNRLTQVFKCQIVQYLNFGGM